MTRLLILLAALVTTAQSGIIVRGPVVAVPTYVINQNLEGTGYDNGETWTPENGFVDPDYTGTVLRGSQSLRFPSGVGKLQTHTTFTAQSNTGIFCDFRFIALPSDNIIVGPYLQGTSHDTYMTVDSSGNVKLIAGGVTSSASATQLVAGTTYHVWMDDAAGSTAKLDISTSLTRPTVDGSGNVHLTGTADAGSVNTIYCYKGTDATSVTADVLFDHVLVSSAGAIGNNP